MKVVGHAAGLHGTGPGAGGMANSIAEDEEGEEEDYSGLFGVVGNTSYFRKFT